MKILALADNDAIRWALPGTPVDLLISCGDVHEMLIRSAAEACSARWVAAVKGNHDEAGGFAAPIRDVHLEVLELPGGLRIGGFNGCWRYKPVGRFLYEQQEAVELLRGFPAVDVFIAHNSPRGMHETDPDVHQGFQALGDYIRIHAPQLLVHGHQHMNRETQIGGTRVIGVYGHALIDL